MPCMHPKDISIVGGGPVGASLALALSGTPLDLSLVEAHAPAQPGSSQEWDARVYAISPQSRTFLESMQAWPCLDRGRLAPVRRMLVFGDAGTHVEFSAYESGVPELAWILEAGALARALWAKLQDRGRVELICPSVPQRLEVLPGTARLELASGRIVESRLVVGADGANSFVRREVGLKADTRPYGQLGVVANFQCRRPHRDTAFQWFRGDGVLAWLPLPGERMSMVWSTAEEHARELLSLTPEQLCQRVAAAGAHSLGELTLITPPAAFPIASLRVPAMTGPRVALIGDAAHVVHPLAGQGVNLGLADAQQLSRLLAEGAPHGDAGDPMLLRRFARSRSEDTLAMRWATDGLAKLFAARGRGAAGLRNWGLNSVNRAPVIKTLLARHALG